MGSQKDIRQLNQISLDRDRNRARNGGLMKNIIDGWAARNLIQQAVAERGSDYVYQEEFGHTACQYIVGSGVNAKPACIVGLALTKGGVDFKARGRYINGSVGYAAGKLTDLNPGLEFTRDAIAILAAAQGVQDEGGTWGMAEAAAAGVYASLLNFRGSYINQL